MPTKVSQITIRGFRGFNEEQTIPLHDKLTIIYGPNSYGKTSISESLEWLLFGTTSRTDHAHARDEYRGSYRNSHCNAQTVPYVEVQFVNEAQVIRYRAELDADETPQRFVDGVPTVEWPIPLNDEHITPPFILQHALKDLLLAKPDDRFQRFARLLGLEAIDHIQKDFVSLCTKPDSQLPPEAKALQQKISALTALVAQRSSMVTIRKCLEAAKPSLDQIYAAIHTACQSHVPAGTSQDAFVSELLRLRETQVEKVFRGHLRLEPFSETEREQFRLEKTHLINRIAGPFLNEYFNLLKLTTAREVTARAQFFDIGIAILARESTTCPFCSQTLSLSIRERVAEEHRSLHRERQEYLQVEAIRANVSNVLNEFRGRLGTLQKHVANQCSDFLAVSKLQAQLERILVPKYEDHFVAIGTALEVLASALKRLTEAYDVCLTRILAIEESIRALTPDQKFVTHLSDATINYLEEIDRCAETIAAYSPSVGAANGVLHRELDIIAGTEDLRILVDLLESRESIRAHLQIRAILEGMKQLRRSVDQLVGHQILDVIAGEFSADVMAWYGQIKTSGDPDVHFGGFDLDRTTKGDLKARRVQVKAHSYGKDLVSAVSSLSESKLNALGLCISIAANLRSDSPFDFLVIDDPIQSWDAEHEVQFVEVIRSLIDRGKQVILLSHNRPWLEQVRRSCESINGFYYELHNYDREGPRMKDISWMPWQERLDVVNALVTGSDFGAIHVQQAEEEIRIVVCELTAAIYRKVTSKLKSAHNLGGRDVRTLLTEAGVERTLVDRIVSTFQTTDAAHHAGANYSADRQRIRIYHSWAHELAKCLKKGN